MQKISGPGATAGGEFTTGNPYLDVPGTIVTADWANSLQRELLAILSAQGLTPDTADDAQVLAAIQLLADASADAALTDKLVGIAQPQFRRDQQQTVCLFSSGELKSPTTQGISAGRTSGPPISGASKNTLLANGYDGVGSAALENQQPGHMWPWQSVGAQMQGDSSVADGWFPACLDGTGLNAYSAPQFVTTPGMLSGHGGKVVITLDGLLDVKEAGANWRINLALTRNQRSDWNSGDGGEVGVAGAFKANRTMLFSGPNLTLAQFGSSQRCQIVVELVAYFHRQLYATVHFYSAAFDGESAPTMDTRRSLAYSFAGNVTMAETVSRWRLHYMIDNDAGGYNTPGAVCNTPLGGPGTTPPKGRQDGLGATFDVLHQRVDFYPAPD